MEIATIIISGFAICISIAGLIFSYLANKKSDKIQVLQTRPWLNTFINSKCNPNGEFYDCHVYEDYRLGFAVSIGIENIGKSPASDIKVWADVFIEDTKFVDGPNQEKLFVLNQDKTYYIKKVHIYDYPKNKEALIKLGQMVKENKIGIKANINISYCGLINNETYGTRVSYLIKKKEYRYDGVPKIT